MYCIWLLNIQLKLGIIQMKVDNENWIGSEHLKYTVLDFSVDTTLIDLGLNFNGFKPSYCDDGEVQYTGPVNFAALRNLMLLMLFISPQQSLLTQVELIIHIEYYSYSIMIWVILKEFIQRGH